MKRRLSQPYITRTQNQSALVRRQTIHVHKPPLVKQDSKVQHVNKLLCFHQSETLSFQTNILKRRNRRTSVANAITVAGVKEALLVGQLV